MFKIRCMAFLMVLTMFALLPGCARQSSGSGIADSTTQTQSSGTEDSDTALLPDLSAKEIADAIMAVFDGQELSPITR